MLEREILDKLEELKHIMINANILIDLDGLTKIIDSLREYLACIKRDECKYLILTSGNQKSKVMMMTGFGKIISKPLYISDLNLNNINKEDFNISPLLEEIIYLLLDIIFNIVKQQQKQQ